MNLNRHEELNPRQQVLPNYIIEKVYRLHQIFYSQLPNLSNEARATGMVFFYRFYEHEKNISNSSPKEFALFAISCLHLGTKVCEKAIPLSKFSSIISNAKGDVRIAFQDVFDTLDGIKIPSYSSDNFIVELNQKLIDREMRTIIALGFNFDVIQPYDFFKIYIEKILKWHLALESEFFKPLKDELVEYCSRFLNNLQPTTMFYIYAPEILAIAAIHMTFRFIKLPLVSPAGNPWYSFLVPNLDYEEVDKAIDLVYKFFTEKFNTQKIPSYIERRTKVPDNFLETWLNYPYIPLKNVPLCPPPPLAMVDHLVEGSSSFKKCELDHVPQFPLPPYLHAKSNSPKPPPNSNLHQIQTEFPMPHSKKDHKSDDKKHKKRKNSLSPSRHIQSQHYDHPHDHRDGFHQPQTWHHQRSRRRSSPDYDYDYEYKNYHIMPHVPQNERREQRWHPIDDGRRNWPSQRRRDKDDGYYDIPDARRGPPFSPQIGRPRDRDGRPIPPPPPPPLIPSGKFYRRPPPPERGFHERDERERERERERSRLNKDRDKDARRNEDDRNGNRNKGKESDRNRERNSFNGRNKSSEKTKQNSKDESKNSELQKNQKKDHQ